MALGAIARAGGGTVPATTGCAHAGTTHRGDDMSELLTADAEVDQEPSTVEAVTTDEVVAEEALVEEDLLVEDVSIDGMCGVY
jgi:mycofactocin precursor